MSAPNTPADFKALISDPTSSMCGNFLNTLLKLPVLIYKLVDYLFDSSGNPSKAFVNQVLKTGSFMFSGCLQTEDGTVLLCDGRQVSQTTYADLYAAIGATYGTATSGNFKLPDFRGRFPVGIGSSTDTNGNNFSTSLATKGGECSHILTANEQGNLAVSIVEDDGDDRTGTLVSLRTVTLNGTVFGNAGSGATQGPTNVNLTQAPNPHAQIPPFLPAYIYIVC